MKFNKTKAFVGLGVCFVAQALIHRLFLFPTWVKNYEVKSLTSGGSEGLSSDQLLATLAGFREITAGILWVKADEFFDEGNYDAILPIIRLVTWLDPHEIDVYATGMWHIGYNFTDEDSRSDRRYVPSALALGKEGALNNPYTYELFFETGWIWYHKVDDDYGKAVSWWEQAASKPDIQPARRNILAMAYLRNGQIDKALERYQELLDSSNEKFNKDPNVFQNRQERDTVENNYDNLLVRMSQRGYFAEQGGYYDQGNYDTKPPYDVKFSAQVTVTDPLVLKIQGFWGVLPIGNRIRLVIRDKDFPTAKEATIDWDAGKDVEFEPLKNSTYLEDQLFVKNQQFSKEVDMSRDPTIYPMTTDKYVVEFYYNPRSAAAHMQDRFGFSGEGLTDEHYLRTDIRPDQRVIYCAFELTKDQIERRGEWANKVPVFRTTGFDPRGLVKADDVIMVPGMRSTTAPGAGGTTPPPVIPHEVPDAEKAKILDGAATGGSPKPTNQ